MRTWKRLMATTLSAAMVVSTMTLPAFAETTKTTGPITVGENSYATLAEAIEANKDVTDPITMEISGNVTWETGAGHGSTPFELATKSLTLVGTTENATFTATGKGVGPIGIGPDSVNNGIVTFENLKIVDESKSYSEGSWELGYLEFRSGLEFIDCEFVNAIMLSGDNGKNKTHAPVTFDKCTFNSNKDNEYAVWVAEGNVTFTDCTFEGARGLKVHECYDSQLDSVVVDSCTFKSLTKKPGIAIGDIYMNGDPGKYGSTTWTDTSDSSITIKDSTFIDCQPGDQKKFIYETDTDVTTFTFNAENNKLIFTPESITASPASTTLKVDGTDTATATVAMVIDDAPVQGEIEWTSADSDIASVVVDEAGKATITGEGVGATVITASYTENGETVTDTINVAVGGAFAVKSSKSSIKLGETVTFTPTVKASDSDAAIYDWTWTENLEPETSDESTLTAKAIQVGAATATLEFTEDDVSGKGYGVVNIEAPELAPVLPESVELGEHFAISADIKNIVGDPEELNLGLSIESSDLNNDEDGFYAITDEPAVVTITLGYPHVDGTIKDIKVEKTVEVTLPKFEDDTILLEASDEDGVTVKLPAKLCKLLMETDVDYSERDEEAIKVDVDPETREMTVTLMEGVTSGETWVDFYVDETGSSIMSYHVIINAVPADIIVGTGNAEVAIDDGQRAEIISDAIDAVELPEGVTNENAFKTAVEEKVVKALDETINELQTNNAAVAPATGLDTAIANTVNNMGLEEGQTVIISIVPEIVDQSVAVTATANEDGTANIETKVESITFKVQPEMMVMGEDGNVVEDSKKAVTNDMLSKNARIKFRLPIPSTVTDKYAKVIHKAQDGSTDTYYLLVQTSGNEKYVEVTVSHFSTFEVSFTNTKPSTGSAGGGSYSTVKKVEKKATAVAGAWAQDANGWWYRYADGTWPAAKWVELDWNGEKTWYYFNPNGYMHSGWLLDGGNWYFLHNVADGTQGYMYTGWKQIDGKWYYFNPLAGGPMGSLLVNTVTPDGYTVDANGVWVQ